MNIFEYAILCAANRMQRTGEQGWETALAWARQIMYEQQEYEQRKHNKSAHWR